ncbi:MAG: hypothetical protein PUP93_03265 [Rhizonema sp. NSF051]|nr:hypothetical protein [Rhizonema sp. NSF051]
MTNTKLAEILDVSLKTVSEIINQQAGISPNTVYRIRESPTRYAVIEDDVWREHFLMEFSTQ